MVKLVRLTSRTDDGTFSAQLQNDLYLTPNSKIAVLNLTFSSASINSSINFSNNEINFSGSTIGNPANAPTFPELQPLVTSNIENGIYLNNEYSLLLDEIQRALNRTLTMTPTQPPNGVPPRVIARNWNTVCSEFYIPRNESEILFTPNTMINFRYSILITPLGGQGPQQLPPVDTMTQNESFWTGSKQLTSIGPPQVLTPNFNFNVGLNIAQLSSTMPSVTNTSYKFFTESGAKMCKGAGLWFTRIYLLTNNGSGLQDNGFGIGLTTDDLSREDNIELDTTNIPYTSRHYEIRCNRSNETYKYFNRAGGTLPIVEQSAAITPQRTAAAQPIDHHDIIWFMVNKGVLTAGCWHADLTTNGVQTVFFSHVLTDEEQTSGFYPYMYMRGQPAHCVAEGMTYSCTSFLSGNNDYERTGMEDSRLLYDMLPSGVNESMIGEVVPFGNVRRLGAPDFGAIYTETTSLKLHIDVWQMLGFSRYKNGDGLSDYRTETRAIGYNQSDRGWAQWGADTPSNTRARSDNFIVELLNVATDSYDASRPQYGGLPNQDINFTAPNLGRRKNILMTIPVNDNNNSIVEFQTSTPIFINLQNSEKINLRNLQIRILDKRFTPIVTVGGGESIITLLIED